MLEVDRTQASTPELRDAIMLRRAMRDLLVLCTIPAAWTGREPDAIAKGVVDVLVTALRVECGYLVLTGDPADIKIMQGTAPPEVLEALLSKCAGELPRAPLVHDLCHAHRAAIVPIRVASRSGFVAAISSRVDFPTETESMLMSVAANQAAISLEAAHLRTQADVERRRLQELMAQAPAAMGLMYGPEHRWTYINDYYIRVTGRTSAADFIGKTLEESLPETETAVFRKLLDDVYRTGNPYVAREMKATLNREGQTVEAYFDFVYQAIRDSAGRIEGVLVHAVEVTDKVLARRTLQTSLMASQRLAAIVESSDDAIVSKDLKGIVTSWNRCAERTFGYKAEEIIGKPITIIIPSELQDDEHRILATIARGERIEHFETVRMKKSGELIDVSLTISPIKDEQGRVIGAAKIARDITQRKRTEKALQMTEKLASVGRLAATVAHELNNPLEAVTNFIFLAQTTDDLPEPAKEYLTLADRELERVSHIAQQTLGFYRDTSARTVVDIRESLDDVLRVFESKLRYKSLKTDINTERGLKIEALGGEVRQVFSNLISNAIDASPTRGVIKVHAKTVINRGTPYAQIAFADYGCGIPDGVKSNIFNPFFTTKSDVGTGLGLWVSKSLVEKHGGRIAFRSTQGKGTVFTLQFPLRAPHHKKEHQDPTA
jgi:PAS domain S-box-containing protein